MSQARPTKTKSAAQNSVQRGSRDFRSLREIEVLEELVDSEIQDLVSRLPTLNLKKGNLLFTPGHRSNLSFFLLEGSVRLYKASEGGELTLELVHQGGIFSNGGLGGSISAEPADEPDCDPGQGLRLGIYAQALRPARVAMIRHEHFGRLIVEHPEVGLKAMSILERRLSLYSERMFDMATRETPARLARLILSLVEDEGVVDRVGIKILHHYTHEELATMVGSKRVAVTKAFKGLKESGVYVHERHIRVSDMGALRRAGTT